LSGTGGSLGGVDPKTTTLFTCEQKLNPMARYTCCKDITDRTQQHMCHMRFANSHVCPNLVTFEGQLKCCGFIALLGE
jgi:hypothetical protein